MGTSLDFKIQYGRISAWLGRPLPTQEENERPWEKGAGGGRGEGGGGGVMFQKARTGIDQV